MENGESLIAGEDWEVDCSDDEKYTAPGVQKGEVCVGHGRKGGGWGCGHSVSASG